MAQYSTTSKFGLGTTITTNGTAIIVGAGTEWLTSPLVVAGGLFTVDGINYEIGAVDTETQLTLTSLFAGADDTGQNYAISNQFTPSHSFPYPEKSDVETAALIKRAMYLIDEVVGGNTTAISEHLVDALDAHDASAISNVPDGFIASTDQQGVNNELDVAITAHTDDALDAHDASAISNVPAGNIASTTQQAVNNELDAAIGDNATAISGNTTAISGNATAISDHLADSVDAHDASAISSVATETIAATDQQAVTEELSQNLTTKTVLFNFTVDTDATLSAAQNLYGKIKITGAILTTSRNLVVATTQRMFFVENTTAQTITIKTAAGTGVAVFAGDKIMLICDGVDVVNPQNPSLLFEYEVVGAAQTEIDVTGLDINAHRSYRVEIEAINATASDASISLYINGNTVSTNYYRNYLAVDDTVRTSARVNDAAVMLIPASSKSTANLVILQNINDLVHARSNVTLRSGASISSRDYDYSHQAAANITQLTWASSVANAIGIGTKIRIYRGDK